MQLEAVRGLYAELHKEQPFHDGTFTFWAEKRTKAHPFHFNDGVTIWLSPVELDSADEFLG